jgi:pyruvate ferredoxin oxidoreductase alpha subunit
MAYRIAEDASVHLPVMVCFDGFTISHTSEEIDCLSQEDVTAIIAPISGLQRPLLDVEQPFQLGQLLPADAYSEYQFKKHSALKNAEGMIDRAHEEFAEVTGRQYAGVESYLCDDAEIILVGMGSIMTTAKWVVGNLRDQGERVGIACVRLFRPFPEKALLDATRNAKILAVVEKNIGLGTSGMMYPDIARTFCNYEVRPKMINLIVGLGGRNVPPETIERCYRFAKDALDLGVTEPVLWPDTELEGL